MKYQFLLFCIGILFTSLAFAGGTDVGSGGESIDYRGRPALRDLVDNTVCLWKPADEFVGALPHFKVILNSVAKANWYLASLYERELPKLHICLTRGSLKPIPTEDQDGLTIVEDEAKHQAAIRLNDMIYVDTKIFNGMDDYNQAYLAFHEITHSFIPLDTPRRNMKVRSFVAVSFPRKSEQVGLKSRRVIIMHCSLLQTHLASACQVMSAA